MNGKCIAAIVITILVGPLLASAAPPNIEAKVNPQKIIGGSSSTITVRVIDPGKPGSKPTIKFEIVDGNECGTLGTSATGDDGVTKIPFTGTPFVENCVAKVRITAEAPAVTGASPEPPTTRELSITVDAGTAPVTKIDGISAIALILIVSFAIDRLIRGLFFLLSYSTIWAKAFPDPELNDVPRSAKAERNRKLIYFVLAAILGVIALGWFGRVRILAALGFTAVNPWLDIVITGLILMGGADRTGQLLQSIGASGAHAAAPQPTPIEITGRLTIDERGHKTLGAEPGESTTVQDH